MKPSRKDANKRKRTSFWRGHAAQPATETIDGVATGIVIGGGG